IKNKPDAHNFKVSLLQAANSDSERPSLKVVGRYQTRRPKRRCKLIFSPGEGCAGIAYQTGSLVERNIQEYDPRNPGKYYEESRKVFSLPQPKAQKLNDKACHFLCIPVRYFNEDIPWGILSIDSLKVGILSNIEARQVEEAIGWYSALFMLE